MARYRVDSEFIKPLRVIKAESDSLYHIYGKHVLYPEGNCYVCGDTFYNHKRPHYSTISDNLTWVTYCGDKRVCEDCMTKLKHWGVREKKWCYYCDLEFKSGNKLHEHLRQVTTEII